MADLYRNAAEEHTTEQGFAIDATAMQHLLQEIYDERIDVRHNIDADLFREVHRVFDDAAAVGTGTRQASGSGRDFLEQLKSNNAVFAAFKVHRLQNDIARQLLDSDGQLKSFEQFATDTQSIVTHHNRVWLHTEYDTAIKRARRAAEMQRFVDEADVLPNLRWVPSTAINPREEHMPFYDRVWPIGDPFFEEHMPGDEWGCQCDLEATDEPVTDNSDLDPKVAPPSPGLRGNPAQTGELFSDDHPYFPDKCSACTFNTSPLRLFQNRTKDCYNCKNVAGVIKSALRKSVLEEYRRLKADANYREVKYDKKSGGLKATHIGHIKHDGKTEETFFGKMTSSDLENECVDNVFKNGHKVILCNEMAKDAQGNPYPALDMILDDRMMDIASITKLKDAYGYQLKRKNSQLARYNARPNIAQPADAVCLYFHDPTMYDKERVLAGIDFIKTGKGKQTRIYIKQIFCVVNGSKEIVVIDVQ